MNLDWTADMKHAARFSISLIALYLLTGTAFAQITIAPKTGESLQSYCQRLDRAPTAIRFKCVIEINRLDPATPTTTEKLAFASNDFGKVFEVARRLHRIPASITLPATGPESETIEDPKKPDYLWSSTLQIKRSASGRIERAEYSSRQEGGGGGVKVTRTRAGIIEIQAHSFGD